VLRAYLLVSATYLVILGAVAVTALAGHHDVIDSNGGLTAVDQPNGWVGAGQKVILGLYATFWVLFLLRQVLAWRRAGGERRQQLKWLMSGAAVCMTVITVNVIAPLLAPNASPAVQAVGIVISTLVAALPVSIGVAILKYHLYDIDRLISRTLAYAIVTGTLVGVYAGLVLLATRVLTVHTPVAVAAATLAAAAMFSPLRRRVQRAVDRRFNRARYDADKTVAAFAARLKDAVDLNSVRDDLAGVVQKALEPSHLSVWMSERG
jgi:hypothetical protein